MDTSKNTDINIVRYKGYDSIYDKINESRWETKNEGYKYEDTLMEDNTSKYLQKNPMMRQFFPYLNRLMSHLINSVKYLMFHYWKDPVLFLLTKEPRLVDAEDVPADFLVRQSNDAVKYLLLEYNPNEPHGTDNIDILKTQRRGEIRYLPFVTTIESITKD